MNKIDTNGASNIDYAQRTSRGDALQGGATSTTARTSSQTTDRIELSSKSGNVSRLRDSAAASSDVRQDRVDALRARIQSGTFNPSGRAVADAILKDERG